MYIIIFVIVFLTYALVDDVPLVEKAVITALLFPFYFIGWLIAAFITMIKKVVNMIADAIEK